MRMLVVLTVCLAATGVARAQNAAGALELTCSGGGAANKVATSNGYAWDGAGNYASSTVTSQRSQGFDDQVDVRVDGDASRIRLPRVMLPPIHGGDGGWFKMTGVVVGEDRIVGTASVNPLNHPKILIDRKTGTISIDGKAGHYMGRCVRRAADAPNAF